jgi:NAD(P)-dependent dehydrogenase (short-subunit alcohol dehydrogenase family)
MTTNDATMAGKVVIVTGGGGAVGKAIAIAMAAEGASVVVNDLGVSLNGEGGSATVADTVAAEITAVGGRAMGNATSITTFENAQQIVQRAVDTFGHVDAVINSAGILRDAIFHKMSEAEFDAVMRVHLYGAWNMSRAAAPFFRQQNSGAFVHMTSAAGLIGSVGQANYAAAKMGIVGLSRSIAMEMQRFGVRSNCIAPHAFGRMVESVPGLPPDQHEAYMAKRRATTRGDQIAPLAVFLSSDGAKDISGQIFGARGNEVYLYSQPRPIRTLQRGDGWSSHSLAATLPGAWKSSLTPLERTKDVFPWDAV